MEPGPRRRRRNRGPRPPACRSALGRRHELHAGPRRRESASRAPARDPRPTPCSARLTRTHAEAHRIHIAGLLTHPPECGRFPRNRGPGDPRLKGGGMRKKFALAFATVLRSSRRRDHVASASGPTVVAEGFACGVYDGNGQVFITTNSSADRVRQRQGRAEVQRQRRRSTSADVLQLRQHRLQLRRCRFGSTTDWSDKVGYNGNSQLTCTTFRSHADDGQCVGRRCRNRVVPLRAR